MSPRDLKVGDVVQLNPEAVGNEAFAGAFMIVTEPKSWGAQGYVEGMGSECVCSVEGAAYYRAPWAAMEYVGAAQFVRASAYPPDSDGDSMDADRNEQTVK